MSESHVLLDEDFSDFDLGMFSAAVGPATEYHYLPEAGPKQGWSVACFASREAGYAWFVDTLDEHRVMRQTFNNPHAHVPPILIAGDELWADYTLTAKFRPQPGGARCGVVFRYRNNRCYYFFGFCDGRVALSLVEYDSDFHTPYVKILAEYPHSRVSGRDYTAVVTVEGAHIRAELAGVCVVEATDSTFAQGKIGLLADSTTSFRSVRVTAPELAHTQFALLRSKRERELDDLRAANPKPLLWKKFSTEGFGAARNLRFGDLTGNGVPDLVIGQIDHHGLKDDYSEVGCITAMTFDGEILWQSGTPDRSKYELTNDVSLQIHDIDGDGRNEVIYTRDFEIVVADGATGKVKYSAPTPASKSPANRYARILGDCLFFCDLRGIGRMADIVIKDRYWHFWVLDDKLNIQWERACRTGHYPHAADIDGDGHDELFVGYAVYRHDGQLVWNIEKSLPDHVDGVAVANFNERPGSEQKILYAGSDAGMIFADLEGRILKRHRIGHVQNPTIARFRADLPGLQAVSVNFWGTQGILHFFDGNGDIYHSAEPLNMGSMCLPVNWTGRDEEYFVLNPNPVHGGMFDGWGRPVVMFPEDGHPDMAYAVLDITGDCRDEIVVWDPHQVWVYTQDDNPRGGRLYQPKRNSLANYSNYQATVSLPGWNSGG